MSTDPKKKEACSCCSRLVPVSTLMECASISNGCGGWFCDDCGHECEDGQFIGPAKCRHNHAEEMEAA